MAIPHKIQTLLGVEMLSSVTEQASVHENLFQVTAMCTK